MMVLDLIAHIICLGGLIAWTYFEIEIFRYRKEKQS